MAYDFEFDDEKVTAVVETIYHSYNELWHNCDGLYDELDSMEDSWSGDTYNNFVEGVRSYEGSVRGIPSILWAFREALIDAQEKGNELITNVKSSLDIF